MPASKLPLPSDSCSGLESSAVELKPPVVVVQIVIAQHVAFSNGFPVEKVFINDIIGDRFKTKSIDYHRHLL